MNEEEQPTMQSKMADDPVAETEQEEIAEAKEDNDSSGRGARWLNFKIEKQNLRYKVEALLRDSFAFAVATSHAIFGIGVVVPSSMGQILPFLTASLAFIFPTLEFTVLGLHPGIIGYWFILSVFITVLLAAATVSNDDIGNLRRKAEMILNDGGRWNALPYFRQPSELKRFWTFSSQKKATCFGYSSFR